MILKALAKRARFRRGEDGGMTVEFAIYFPLYMFIMLVVIEYALVTIQQAMLERSMDLVVRDIRLGINLPDTEHDTIKDAICGNMVGMRNCSQNMLLEMIVQDAYVGINLPNLPTCVDREEEVQPATTFQNGGSNSLMILRACAQVDPLFPTTQIGRTMSGEDDLINLTATTAFVQEP